jgi:ribosomal protein S3
LKLVNRYYTTARPGIIGKGGQEVDKLKELKKITDKEVQINIFE